MSANQQNHYIEIFNNIVFDDFFKNTSKLDASQLVTKFNEFLVSASVHFNIKLESVRLLNAATIAQIEQNLSENKGLTFVMRHGEQQISSSLLSLSAEDRKIKMMQEGHNAKDPITLNSAFESLSTFFVIVYLKEKYGYDIELECSENQRAKQPAEALATLLNCESKAVDKWSCVNYPDDEVIADLDLKTQLNNGSLPWDKDKVDAVIGKGTFKKITGIMQQELASQPANKIKIIITHTQPIDALCAAGNLIPKRLSNFGLVTIDSMKNIRRFDAGFYDATQRLDNLCLHETTHEHNRPNSLI